MGYSGEFYAQGWGLLGRKFGRPYLIVDAQLNILRKQQPIRMHDSTAICNYSITISNLVNVLKQYNYEDDLRSCSTLPVAIEKLPPNLKEKWFFFVDECQEDRSDLTLLENWLARMAFVHEGMPLTKSEQKEDDRPNANKKKRFSKSSNVTASSNANETKQMQNNNFPLADGTHKIWNCPIFKNMNVTDRYAAVRKERLCYGCLGKGHAIKDCTVHPCGINGRTKKHNRLLHSKNQMDKGSHAVNVSAATINQSNQVTSFLQKFLYRFRVVVTGWLPTLSSIVDQQYHSSIKVLRINYKPKARTLPWTFEDGEGSYHNKGTTFKGAFNWSVWTPINLVGKHNIWLQGTEEQLQTTECSH